MQKRNLRLEKVRTQEADLSRENDFFEERGQMQAPSAGRWLVRSIFLSLRAMNSHYLWSNGNIPMDVGVLARMKACHFVTASAWRTAAMEYNLTCDCGLDVWVCEADAGLSTACRCGNMVRVPELSALQALAVPAPETVPPLPKSIVEIMAPVRLTLRDRNRTVEVMAALTADAVWLQDTWQSRAMPLQGLTVEPRRNGKELALTIGPEPASEQLTLTFTRSDLGQRWVQAIQEHQQHSTDAKPSHRPEGIALLQQQLELPHEVVSPVEYTGQTQWHAERGLQLRAGIAGADAVVGVQSQPCRDLGGAFRRALGVAIRVADADVLSRLRVRWFGERVAQLTRQMLIWLAVYIGLLFASVTILAKASPLSVPTDETLSESLYAASLGLGLLFVWPVTLVLLLRFLRWPQLLRTVGLAVLVATTGRELAVRVGHLIAVRTTGIEWTESKLWLWLNPFDLLFLVFGIVLCVRAWRLARQAPAILPPEMQGAPAPRGEVVQGLFGLTCIYGLVCFGWCGYARYDASVYALMPGVDAQREQQALQAMDEAHAQANNGDLVAAERSWLRSLKLWEELTSSPSAPAHYRGNLAMTLNNLGWLRLKQGRREEAAKYYERVAALVATLDLNTDFDSENKKILGRAPAILAELRGESNAQQVREKVQQLEEKAQSADRKYEEAQVLTQKGDLDAVSRCQEAISLWEEILPQITNPDYRKSIVAQLAIAYLRLGELQRWQGKLVEAETAVKKAIDHGEKAVALDPERPLPRHNLDVAHARLDVLRELALQQEINKLCEGQRFADAIDRFSRGIEDQEEQVRTGKDRNAAIRRLAYRLDRFAWFLAHCPDGRVRDTKAAVKRARRATELQPELTEYWYTLAMVQYRNGDWRDSLQALDQLKARDSEYDASGWLLVAMNRQQLKHREEARTALRRAADWIAEQERKIEGNAQLRYQYEMMRPAIDALRREAEQLLEGKDAAEKGIG
jgi:tetratricopeptide (TPR) repeat protein